MAEEKSQETGMKPEVNGEKPKRKKGKVDALLIAIVISIIAGGVAGWFLGEKILVIKFLGDLFLNALKMIIVPLVLASMIVGIASLGDIRNVGRTGMYTVVFYMITTGIAVLTGIFLVNLIQPGIGIQAASPEVSQALQEKGFSISKLILGMVPENIFQSMANTDVLPIIVFSLLFGAVLTMIGEPGKPVLAFFRGVNEAIMKMVNIIMYIAPVGIFSLIACRLGEAGGGPKFLAELMGLGKYAGTVILGLGFHGLVTLPIILWIFGRRHPYKYMAGMFEAITTAFSTDSSSATLPITIECVEENNKVKNRYAAFVLPLGATINMDGTAMYEAVAAIFIAQSYGVPLTWDMQVIIFLTATLAAIGAAGIPEAGLVTMVIVLKAVGLPVEGIALILTIDWFLDRCRTMVNVWGDSVGAAVVENLETSYLKKHPELKEKVKPD